MKIKNFRIPTWTFAIILLFLCIVSFGLLVPELGFYWDDWAKTLVNRVFGLDGYWQYYAGDRPLSGWTHIFFISLIGDSPASWHVITLILRWLSAVGMWWCLTLLWPKAKIQNALASLIFVIYPVFTMQSIAVTFHQQWLQFVLFFLSLGMMIKAVLRPRHFIIYSLIGVVTLFLQVSVTEYFAPLEFIRPIVLWYLISNHNASKTFKAKAAQVIKYWLPYLLGLIIYLVWRLFFMELPNADPYRPELLFGLFSMPVSSMVKLFKVSVLDTLQILISSWSPVFDIGVSESPPPFTLFTWGLSVLVFIGLSVYLWLFTKNDDNVVDNSPNRSKTISQVLIIGLIAMALGCVPAWISGRQVLHDFHSNRYALPGMFGASLILAGIIEWLIQKQTSKIILTCLIISITAGFHLRTSNEYRWLWKDQTRYFWQLSWRAPYLEPGTAIISEDEPFANQGLFSTSAALNLLYPQPEEQEYLSYWMYTLYPKYASGLPEPLDISFNTRFRTLAFQGQTPDTILVFNDQTKGNCLWVINPQDHLNPYFPDLLSSAVPLSNLSRIHSRSVSDDFPPVDLFGDEPDHGWCYYYEKADLSRQTEDWDTVVSLGQQVLAEGFSPDKSASNSPHEWVPFIEGFAYEGYWDTAEELTFAGIERDKKYTEMYCNLWKSIDQNVVNDEQEQAVFNNIYGSLNCERFTIDQ